MKTKSDPLLYKFVEIIGGVTVGIVLAYTIPEVNIALGILAGLLVTLTVDMIRTHYHTEKVFEEFDQKLVTLIDAVGAEESRRRLVLEALSCGTIDIPVDRMPDVWNRLSWSMSQSYVATNYIEPDEIYKPKFADSVVAVQRAKIVAQNVRISKVFIVDSPLELKKEAMRELIKHHREARISLRYMEFDAIRNHPTLGEWAKRLASIDFAVFDERVVLLWHLDRQRHVTRVEVRLGPEEAALYLEFFAALKKEARDDFDEYLT